MAERKLIITPNGYYHEKATGVERLRELIRIRDAGEYDIDVDGDIEAEIEALKKSLLAA